LFRKDRVKNLKTTLKKIPINRVIGWCDDSKSNKYNKLIKYPYNFSSEKLYRKDNIYDIILVLNYNMNPVKKNKGSAIFIHISKRNYKKTEGCVAIRKKELLKIIINLKKKTKVKIS
jgi:L,D-peptidoglycan transpeptidase YkuD (ErfK/YbiS/YcfS/YnhG family)